MVVYTCEKCNKKFTKRSTYIYHLNRLRPCNFDIKVIHDTNLSEAEFAPKKAEFAPKSRICSKKAEFAPKKQKKMN